MKANKLKSVLLTMLAVAVFVAMCIPSFMTISTNAATTNAKSINIGTSDITVPEGGWTTDGGNYVNFGKYSDKTVKYRVLSNDGSTMLIDSDQTLFRSMFDANYNKNYATSDVRTAIYSGDKFFPNATEKSIVKSTDLKSDGTSSEPYKPSRYTGFFGFYDNASSGNYSFLLSAQQVNDLYASDKDAKKSGTYDLWWLRSTSSTMENACKVGSDGALGDNVLTTNSMGVAPASNLDLTKVLFSSDAEFSKTGALAKVKTTETKTWNLTIKDSNLSVTAQKATIDAEKKVSVLVKLTGENITQVSVVITNGDISSSDTEILYYGKLDGITASSTDQQTGTFTLPSDFNDDTDKVYVLAEDLDSATSDLASAPVEIDGFQKTTTTDPETGTTTTTEEIVNKDVEGNITEIEKTTTETKEDKTSGTKTTTEVKTIEDKKANTTTTTKTEVVATDKVTTTEQTVTTTDKDKKETVVTTKKVEDKESNVAVETKATSGVATTEVKLVEGQKIPTTVTLDATAVKADATDVTKTEVTLPKETVTALKAAAVADTKVETVEIKTDVATLEIDNTALQTLINTATDQSLVLTVAKTDSTVDKTENATATFELTAELVGSDNQRTPVFNDTTADNSGTIKVNVAYTPEQADNTIVVYYVDGNGVRTNMNATYEDGVLSWDTNHFSTYEVQEIAKATPDPTPVNPDDSKDKTDKKTTTKTVKKTVAKAGDSASTGDTTQLAPLMALVLISGTALIAVAVIGRRKSHNK